MYKATLTKNLRLTLPSSFRKFLKRGKQFMVYESDDAIMLKQIQEKPWPADMNHGIEPMSLEEIDEVVHEVRRKRPERNR